VSNYITIKLRRGTASQWTTTNPILAEGEVGLETNTRKFKVGDGATAWNSLTYWGGSDSGASAFVDLTDVPNTYSGQGGKGVRVKADASGLEFYSLVIAAGDLPTGIDAAKIADGTVSNAEFQFINSLTSNAQTQINGKVPYSGANANVDLGEYELKAGQITLDTSPTGTASVGTTRWNDTLGSTETTLKGGNVILKNGVDLVARIVNKVTPNTTLTKAAYQAVKVTGAQGQRLAVALAQANNDNNSADTLGLVIESIATNQEGFIMTVGTLEGINTTGSLQGETWADGDVLYLSPTTAGRITNIKPTAPNHTIIIGYVEYSHANNGKIYVKIMNGWELGELHDVDLTESKTTPIDADNLFLQDSADNSIWKLLSWANLKATLKTYFDTLYQAAGSGGGTDPATVGDSFVLEYDFYNTAVPDGLTTYNSGAGSGFSWSNSKVEGLMGFAYPSPGTSSGAFSGRAHICPTVDNGPTSGWTVSSGELDMTFIIQTASVAQSVTENYFDIFGLSNSFNNPNPDNSVTITRQNGVNSGNWVFRYRTTSNQVTINGSSGAGATSTTFVLRMKISASTNACEFWINGVSQGTGTPATKITATNHAALYLGVVKVDSAGGEPRPRYDYFRVEQKLNRN
jgi:nitrogen fixation protein